MRFHDLRHTFASLTLLCGGKPKVVSEALGHSSVAFTMDTYSHIIEGMQSEAKIWLQWQRSSGVEQRTHKPLVGGSNPPAATNKHKSSLTDQGITQIT